jgi:hypothetical protein
VATSDGFFAHNSGGTNPNDVINNPGTGDTVIGICVRQAVLRSGSTLPDAGEGGGMAALGERRGVSPTCRAPLAELPTAG